MSPRGRRAISRANTTHGHFRHGRMSPTYSSYTHAKQRCKETSGEHWKHYGALGVKFLFVSFEQFLAEVGPRPKGKTLHRKDPSGNYEPGNVRWATPLEQRHNRRKH